MCQIWAGAARLSQVVARPGLRSASFAAGSLVPMQAKVNILFIPHALLGILQVGKGTSYTPTAEDVGSCLKCEVAAVDVQQNRETGSSSSPSTARVRPVPLWPQRALVPVAPPRGGTAAGKFTALTYNLLADLYASVSPASAALKAICMLYAQSHAADFTLTALCKCRTESLGFAL